MHIFGNLARLLVVTATLSLVALACGTSSRTDEDVAAAAPTSETPVPEPEQLDDSSDDGGAAGGEAVDEEEVDEEEVDEVATSTKPPEFVPGATPVTWQFSPLDAGQYRVDTLGTPFTFMTEENLFVQPNADGFFVLTHPASQGPDDRDMAMQRISNFALPDNPAGTVEEQGDGWPADDVDGWLDSLDAGIEVTNREQTVLGGRDAVSFEARLADGFECGEEFCAGVATNRLVSSLSFNPGASYRVWVVDQGDESPILVHMAIRNDAQVDWFETAEAVLDTLAFDSPAPNPIPAEGDLWTFGFPAEVPAGPVEIPALGGIRFELTEERFIVQNDDEHHFILVDAPADSEILLVDRDGAGDPLSTVDELVAAVTSGSTTATETESATMAGFEARVFDIESPSTGGPPTLTPVGGELGEVGWSAPKSGRIWVAETDRGLVMITAEAFESADDLPLVLDQSQLVVDTLEFISLE